MGQPWRAAGARHTSTVTAGEQPVDERTERGSLTAQQAGGAHGRGDRRRLRARQPPQALAEHGDVGKVVGIDDAPRRRRRRDVAGARRLRPGLVERLGRLRHRRAPGRRHRRRCRPGRAGAASTSAAPRPCSRRGGRGRTPGGAVARRPWSTARCRQPGPARRGRAAARDARRALVGDLLEIEPLAERATAHSGARGHRRASRDRGRAGLDSVLTRHFEAPRLLVVRGTRRIGSSAMSTTSPMRSCLPRWAA